MSDDKIADWIGYSADQTSDIRPGSILNEDLALVVACLDMVHRRRHVEYGVLSPASSSVSEPVVTNDSLMHLSSPRVQQIRTSNSVLPVQPPQSRQEPGQPRLLPQTAVRDMMKTLDSGNQAGGPALGQAMEPAFHPGGGRTPSEASSMISMTSSARVIMEQVAVLEENSGHMMKQKQQQLPPASQEMSTRTLTQGHPKGSTSNSDSPQTSTQETRTSSNDPGSTSILSALENHDTSPATGMDLSHQTEPFPLESVLCNEDPILCDNFKYQLEESYILNKSYLNGSKSLLIFIDVIINIM